MSITAASKQQAIQVMLGLVHLLNTDDNDWYQGAQLDTDDHGYLITIRITSRSDMEAAGAEMPSVIDGVKICLISVGY